MKITLEETARLLTEAQKLVLTAHVNPDGDAIGSLLGMYHGLKGLGKEVILLLDDELPANFSLLPGFDLIKPPTEGETTMADLLVVLDASPDERLGKVLGQVAAPILNIDHHVTNLGGDYPLYLREQAAATCEILADLLATMDISLTQEIAVCLYTGLATDTGFFRYANTTADTMSAAAQMIAAGVKPHIISETLEQKPYAEVKRLAAAIDRSQLFAGGKAVGIFLDEAFMDGLASTEGFIDAIRIVKGAEIALLLKAKEPGVCRVSMRSKGADVARIAAALGGGGHIRAAGCTLKMPFDEARRTIVKAVEKALGY